MNKKSTRGLPLAAQKKWCLLGVMALFLTACNEAEKPNEADEVNSDTVSVSNETANNPNDASHAVPQVQIPEGYDILQEATGDLDGDEMDEKVIVFNTNREGEMGNERELRVYVLSDGLWSLWYKAIGPVLSSERGGVLGDPFDNLAIRNGQIVIDHYGGSIDRWSYSHSYQHLEDNWYLVEATLSYFQICQYSETYTYDLMNATGYHSRHKDECDDNGVVTKTKIEVEESLVLNKADDKPVMNGFLPGDVEVAVKGKTGDYRY